jgi:hypothetical protein
MGCHISTGAYTIFKFLHIWPWGPPSQQFTTCPEYPMTIGGSLNISKYMQNSVKDANKNKRVVVVIVIFFILEDVRVEDYPTTSGSDRPCYKVLAIVVSRPQVCNCYSLWLEVQSHSAYMYYGYSSCLIHVSCTQVLLYLMYSVIMDCMQLPHQNSKLLMCTPEVVAG